MAYAVESFTIRSQPNATNNILVKIRENLDYEYVFLEDQEKDWKQICWADGGKCSVTNRGIKLRHMNLEVQSTLNIDSAWNTRHLREGMPRAHEIRPKFLTQEDNDEVPGADQTAGIHNRRRRNFDNPAEQAQDTIGGGVMG